MDDVLPAAPASSGGETGKVYVFGTGLYINNLEEEPVDESDNSGCSLADPYAEAGSAAVNLLTVMVLLAVVFLSKTCFSKKKRHCLTRTEKSG